MDRRLMGVLMPQRAAQRFSINGNLAQLLGWFLLLARLCFEHHVSE
jgi:hypothetical protein